MTAAATVQQAKRDLDAYQSGEREKIQATQEGSQARLDAIDAAIKDEQARNLQDTEFYRSLGVERVNVARQMADQEAKVKADAGKESAEHTQKMGQLELAAVLETQSWLNSARRISDAEAVSQQLAASEMEFQLKRQSLQQQMTALDSSGKEYENKLKTLQDREIELVREHEDQKTAIMDSADIQQNNRMAASYQQFANIASQGLTSVLMRHQTFASMVTNLGNQVVSGMMQNAIQSVMTDNFDKESKAAKAARTAYTIGLSMGGPAGIILGPIFGAAAFASMMAFANGGVVPGVGNGDVVPAMLTPGEGVVPKGVMDGLSNVARSGGFSGSGPSYTIRPMFSPKIQALDAAGVDRVLEKHADKFQRHFERTLRKMNKG